jgi:hypothetical protein
VLNYIIQNLSYNYFWINFRIFAITMPQIFEKIYQR